MPPPYCYDYPRPAVTVDVALFSRLNGALRILLIRRKHDPFAGHWALPGGFIEIDESVPVAARRELQEETGLTFSDPLDLLGVYGDPGRDPRGPTISIVHLVVLSGAPPAVMGSDDAAEAAWLEPADAHDLAFDHARIVRDALDRIAREEKS